MAIVSVLVASPATAASQSSFGTFSYTGNAYGTSASLADGTVVSGPSAFVTLGCTSVAGITKSNTVASVHGAPLVVTGTVNTTATTSATATSAQSQTTAVTQRVNLLNGAITADAVQASSTTSVDAQGFHTSAQGSNLVNLVVGGNQITATPAPNTTIQLAGLGTVVLNEETSTIHHAQASLTVNMIHVTITEQNSLAALGTQIIVSHATSDLEGPVAGVVDGKAYGTSARVGSVVRSGPSALVVLACRGTDGNVVTNQVASVDIPDVATTGSVVDTAQGTVSSSSASSETTSTVQAVNLLSSLVTADVVKADAHAMSDGTTPTFSDSGSQFVNLTVSGHPEITANVAPNTKITIAGLGTLYLHRVILGTNNIEVRMIELVVAASNTHNLPPGLDVRIAVAEASID